MALTRTDAEPVRSAKRFGYAIKMMSGDQIVSVIITDEALQDIASTRDASLERLGQYRSQIEQIASRKHTAGQIEHDGSVCVTSADVRAPQEQYSTVADRFDVTLEILPSGDLRVFGNERGFNAARDYFKFSQAFLVSEPDEWCHVSVGFYQPATLDAATKFAKDIQARSSARVGVINAGAVYGVSGAAVD